MYGIVALVLFVLAAAGWIGNLVKILHLDGMCLEMIVRTFCLIFAPLGAIAGYL